MAKEMLLDKLKRLSEAAWNRAERRYAPYDRQAEKVEKYSYRRKHDCLGPEGEEYLENVLIPRYKKLGDAYDDASNFAERLENKYRAEKAKKSWSGRDVGSEEVSRND